MLKYRIPQIVTLTRYLELIHYKDFSVVIRMYERYAQNVDFVDAIKKGKEISMKIFWGSLHVCEKGIHFYFCPQYARNKIKIPHKQHVYKGISKEYSYSKRDLNPHSRNGQGILSPSCLPIPPFEHPRRERAENETRTRDPNLGKVMLYQLSYFRVLF